MEKILCLILYTLKGVFNLCDDNNDITIMYSRVTAFYITSQVFSSDWHLAIITMVVWRSSSESVLLHSVHVPTYIRV